MNQETLQITVLTVPDCPNAPLVRERLDAAVAALVGAMGAAGPGGQAVAVTAHEIDDLEQAEALGMNGSPTVLVDGVDPFAAPGARPSVSCRLYRDADGRTGGAPSVDALRDAVRAALIARGQAGPSA